MSNNRQNNLVWAAKFAALFLVEACVLIAAYMTISQVFWMFHTGYVPGPSPRNSETMKFDFEDREPGGDEPPVCDPKMDCPVCREIRAKGGRK